MLTQVDIEWAASSVWHTAVSITDLCVYCSSSVILKLEFLILYFQVVVYFSILSNYVLFSCDFCFLIAPSILY